MFRSWYNHHATFTKKESVVLSKNVSNVSLLKNLFCIMCRISFYRVYRNKELVILMIVFFYFAKFGLELLLPHLMDTIHMKLPLYEQLHWFLLNAGWRTPHITDITAFSEYSTVILGMVKDSQQSLPYLLYQMNIFACSFKYSHFFVLESNSKDNTAQLIKRWGNEPVDCAVFNKLKHQSILNYQIYDIENDKDMKYTSIHHMNTSTLLNNTSGAEINAKSHKQSEFHVDKDIFQPKKEFPDVMDVMRKHKSRNPYNVREERYVIYRNYLLDQVSEWYKKQKEDEYHDIDYLIWVDLDIRAFDISSIVREFSVGFKLGYDVLCTNGIKYGGWYYDTYASVLYNGTWLQGIERWKITNQIRDYRFYDMHSCFGGFAAYKFEYLMHSHCKYEHFDWAYANIPAFAQFSDTHMVHKACEHLPLNFCLRQNGAKLAVATRAHSFYGTADNHG